jgi:hypothetical protein
MPSILNFPSFEKACSRHFLIKNPQSVHFQKNGVEIRRRLGVLKKMWEEDQLKPEIYTKMIQLSEGRLCVLL